MWSHSCYLIAAAWKHYTNPVIIPFTWLNVTGERIWIVNNAMVITR